MNGTIKKYSEVIRLPTFQDRLEYLKLHGVISELTFGGNRYLNQMLYSSSKWKRVRSEVIIRDEGCDLAHKDYPIRGTIIIHHLNPITIEDILNENPCIFDLENLICSSNYSHNKIHYGSSDVEIKITERKPGDTTLWR